MQKKYGCGGAKYGQGGAAKKAGQGHAIKTGSYKCGGPVSSIVNAKSLRPK